MASISSLQLIMEFENKADRNQWISVIKAGVINARPSNPSYKSIRMSKIENDYEDVPVE